MNGLVPEFGVADNFKVSPTQTGELLVTFIVVAGLTTTVVLPVAEQPLLSVMVTEYNPAIAELAPVLLVSAELLVKEVADQLYVNGAEPPVEDEVRFRVPPAQTGELLDAFTVKPGLTMIGLVEALTVQPCASVTTIV